jgi:hypothetical protein
MDTVPILLRHSGAKTLAKGLWLSFCLLWAAGSVPLTAEPGPDTVRFRNTSAVKWQLKVSSTAWTQGLRLLPGPDGRVPALVVADPERALHQGSPAPQGPPREEGKGPR